MRSVALGHRRTPLHRAARNGHADAVRALIESGEADVNAQTADDGRTPLFYAAQQGHAAVVEVLLRHILTTTPPGFVSSSRNTHPANIPDIEGFAARRGHADVASVFMKGDAGVQHSPRSRTPPQQLCQSIAFVKPTHDVKTMLDVEASFRRRRLTLALAPMMATEPATRARMRWMSAAIVWFATALAQAAFGDRRNDFSSTDEISASEMLFAKATALHFAAHYDHASVIEAFLSADHPTCVADVCDYEQQTALHRAARYGNNDCVVTLLKYHANVNAVTKDGSTPVHFAAFGGHVGVVDA